MISNKAHFTDESFEFIHLERRWWLSLLLLALPVAYAVRLFGTPTPFDVLLSVASILVFGHSFLDSAFWQKRLHIGKGTLALFSFWPLELAVRFPLETVKSVTLSTLFSHLSKRATIVLTVRSREGKVTTRSYPSLRGNLNAAVASLESGLHNFGIETTVVNENLLEDPTA